MSTQTLIILIAVLVALVLVRIILPVIALLYINRSLRKHPTLHGTVGSLRLSLLRGRFTIGGLRIAMTEEASGVDSLVVRIPEVSVTVKLWSLLRRKVFTHVSLVRPELVYATVLNKAEDGKDDQKYQEAKQGHVDKAFVKSPIKKAFEKMIPFRVELDIVEGNIRYIDASSKPQRDIALNNLSLSMRNLSNQRTYATEPASILANGTLYGGDLNLSVVLQPLEEFLTFGMKLELKDAELVQLNEYFRQYANIDAHSGSLDVHTELIAKDGSFKGFLQPVFKNIDIIGAEDSNDSMFKKIWERMVATVIQALENNKVDQLTTRIEIEGQLTDPQVNILAAISGTLKDAFARAIQSTLQNALSFTSIFRSAFNLTAGFVKKMLA